MHTVCRKLPTRTATCVLLLAVLIAACHSGPKASHFVDLGDVPEPSHAKYAPDQLTGRTLGNVPALGIPCALTVSGSYLWVVDCGGNPWLHLIDARDGHEVRSLGQSGAGPGDFAGISAIAAADAVGSAWVYDAESDRMTRVDTSPTTLVTPTTVALSGLGSVARITVLGDRGFFDLRAVGRDTARADILSFDGRPTISAP